MQIWDVVLLPLWHVAQNNFGFRWEMFNTEELGSVVRWSVSRWSSSAALSV